MTFESLIEHANRLYRNTGAAVIEKQHTLCTPLRNGTGRIVNAKYETKATVDYMGRYGERPIAFEAKHCAEDRIDLKRVEPHQRDFLRDWTARWPAIGFVLVSFGFTDFYLIPWDCWDAAVTARAKGTTSGIRLEVRKSFSWWPTGKASIRKDELPKAWKVVPGNVCALDYLCVVNKLWG
jgi:recombination protein U